MVRPGRKRSKNSDKVQNKALCIVSIFMRIIGVQTIVLELVDSKYSCLQQAAKDNVYFILSTN